MLAEALVLAVVVAACGSHATESDPPAGPAVTTAESPPVSSAPQQAWAAPVLAHEVDVVGELDAADLEVVDWALLRFGRAGLRLPQLIDIDFDTTGVACGGCAGICSVDRSPPEITICAPAEPTAHCVLTRRIAVLHELGHLWHRAQGAGLSWPDVTEVVGGHLNGSVDWEDRMKERVAVVISWGLLDQLRRPVHSDLPCSTLFVQFTELTGHPPLGPLEAICHPDAR